MTTYTKLPGQRGFIYSSNGFCYYQDRVSTDGRTLYLKCKDGLVSKGGTCGGRAVLKLETDCFTHTKPHSHSAELHENESLIREFKSKLKIASEGCSTGLLRECYDQVSAETPGAASLVPFRSVESSMALWRRQHFPKNPSTAQAVCETFKKFAGQVNHKFAHFFKIGASTEDGTYILLMNSDDAVKKALKNTPIVQADGTFRSSPKTFYQAVHIFMEANGVVFCFASLWLTGKTENLYKLAFTALKNHLPRGCNPRVIMADYERALQNALQDLFPDADLTGCVFHFCQGVFRNVMKIGLSKLYKTHRKFKSWVNMVFSLPLLPASDICEAWEFLKTEKFSISHLEKKMIAKLKQYIERQWIHGVGPSCLSVFGCDIYNKRSFKVLFDFVLHSLWISHSPKLTGIFNKGRQGRFLGKYCRKKFSKDNLIS